MTWTARLLGVSLVALVVTGCHGVADSPLAPSPAAGGITVRANPPALLLSGSTTQVTARVTDTHGGPLAGAIVRFSGAGLNGSLTTDAWGEASAPLLGSQATTITATVDGVGAQAVSIPAVAPFALEVVSSFPTDATAGFGFVLLQTTPTAGIIGPQPDRLTLTCGGVTTVTVGAWYMRLPCTFPAAGTFPVSATATVSGWTTHASTTVTIR